MRVPLHRPKRTLFNQQSRQMAGLGDQEISEFGDALLTPTTAQTFFGDPLPFAQGSPAPPLTPGALANLLGGPLPAVGSSFLPPTPNEGGRAPAPVSAADAAAPIALAAAGRVKQESSGEERYLDFDVAALTVDELREELRLRGLATSGPRAALTTRLLDAIKENEELSLERLSSQPVKKRKRNNNKREPTRDEFDSEEQYQEAWTKWRGTRDNNNESVKRSRENAKMKRKDHEELCVQRESENQELLKEVLNLRQQVSCLNKVLEAPDSLTTHEQQMVRDILDPVDGLGAALDPPRGP